MSSLCTGEEVASVVAAIDSVVAAEPDLEAEFGPQTLIMMPSEEALEPAG